MMPKRKRIKRLIVSLPLKKNESRPIKKNEINLEKSFTFLGPSIQSLSLIRSSDFPMSTLVNSNYDAIKRRIQYILYIFFIFGIADAVRDSFQRRHFLVC